MIRIFKEIARFISWSIPFTFLIVFMVYMLFHSFDPDRCSGCSGKAYLQAKAAPYLSPLFVLTILFFVHLLVKDTNIFFKEITRHFAALQYKKIRHKERVQRVAAGDLRAVFPIKEKAIKEEIKPPKTPEEKRETLIFYSVFVAFVLAFIAFLYFVLK